MFSVIMAAYQRGEHIKPSIESVLRQSFHDFELCVVSDGPDEATEAAVASFASSKIRYCSMVECFGSQSYPNNCGIAETTAPWIAYLGHDDIWSAHHLSALAEAIRYAPQASVVASGCIFHGPPESRVAWVTGMFDDAEFEITFLPPSSFAHKRSAATTVGGWRDPRVVVEAVDQDLLNRFTAAGFSFASTRQVTVHKFAAGHRYLYYLDQSSDEQSAMLRDARLDQPDGWGAEIAAAKRNGTFTIPYAAATEGAGEKFARSKQMKGLAKTAAEPLSGPVRLEQDNEDRALDWNGLELTGMPHRWSGPNPRPKLRIPFSHNGDARVTLSVVEYKGPLSEVALRSRGRPLPVTVREAFGQFHLETVLPMSSTSPNIIELYTPTMFRPFDDRTDGPRLGIAIGDLTVQPL